MNENLSPSDVALLSKDNEMWLKAEEHYKRIREGR